jgi:hypothetical protein
MLNPRKTMKFVRMFEVFFFVTHVVKYYLKIFVSFKVSKREQTESSTFIHVEFKISCFLVIKIWLVSSGNQHIVHMSHICRYFLRHIH